MNESFFFYDGTNLGYELTSEDFSVLSKDDPTILLGILDHMTFAEMGQMLNVYPSTVHYRVERLIEKGFVTRRERVGRETSKRPRSAARALILTAAGAAVLLASQTPVPAGTLLGKPGGKANDPSIAGRGDPGYRAELP